MGVVKRTGLSLSKRAKRAQYNDLRTRGYTHEQAEAEVRLTDEAIIRARKGTS